MKAINQGQKMIVAIVINAVFATINTCWLFMGEPTHPAFTGFVVGVNGTVAVALMLVHYRDSMSSK